MTPVRTLRRVAVALLASVAAGAGFAHETDSMEELTRAAELGDADAQFDLGFVYSAGLGDFEADRAEALTWYRRSAEQGFARAQSALGSAYAYGHSLEQDFTQAATWCQLSAEQGDAEGHLCMALLYAGGCGVEQDYTESARWYRLAADQGEGQAQARLGDMYANGEGGVQQDPVEADKWYRRAVEPGTYHPKKVAGFEFFSGRPLMIHLFVLARMYRRRYRRSPERRRGIQVVRHFEPLAFPRVRHDDLGSRANGTRRSCERDDERPGGRCATRGRCVSRNLPDRLVRVLAQLGPHRVSSRGGRGTARARNAMVVPGRSYVVSGRSLVVADYSGHSRDDLSSGHP